MDAAEQAKRTMINDRSKGEEEFAGLFRQHPDDGMIFFKRAEAFEAISDAEAANADFFESASATANGYMEG